MNSALSPDEAVEREMRALVQIGTENHGEDHFALIVRRISLARNLIQRKLFRRR